MCPRILKRDLFLTDFQKQVLIGYVLGDGCIEVRGKSGKARLMVEQSIKQKELVDWLYKIFSEFTKTPPKEKNYINKNSIYFSTLSFKQFYAYKNIFYKDKKKILPIEIEQLLTPLSLAVWFMGDGSVKSKECNGRIINTHGFTGPEVNRICFLLKEKFLLQASIRRQKDGLQVYISAKSAITFNNLIAKHVLPSFYYKLPRFKS
jgi:hypothetical protein